MVIVTSTGNTEKDQGRKRPGEEKESDFRPDEFEVLLRHSTENTKREVGISEKRSGQSLKVESYDHMGSKCSHDTGEAAQRAEKRGPRRANVEKLQH